MSGAVPSEKLETMTRLRQNKHFVLALGKWPTRHIEIVIVLNKTNFEKISNTKFSSPAHSHPKFEFAIGDKRTLENNKLWWGDVANKLMSSIIVICILLIGWDYKVSILTL
ncbi:hypothetical protein ACJW31_02G139000 [Castanea mollissima]